LDTDARLSAAKVVKEFEQQNRKSQFGEDWSPCDEADAHERNVGILAFALPHRCSGRTTS
jgi:hypothetical protein